MYPYGSTSGSVDGGLLEAREGAWSERFSQVLMNFWWWVVKETCLQSAEDNRGRFLASGQEKECLAFKVASSLTSASPLKRTTSPAPQPNPPPVPPPNGPDIDRLEDGHEVYDLIATC